MKATTRIALFTLLLLLTACNDSGINQKTADWTNRAELDTTAVFSEEITDLSGEFFSIENIPVELPAGFTDLTFSTSGGTGDVDLYVKVGGRPDSRDFDCSSIGPSNEESCYFAESEMAEYFITLFGASDYEGVTLTLSFDDGTEAEAYDIDLIFSESVTEAQKPLFEAAAERWESIIVSGVPDIPGVEKPANVCDGGRATDPAFDADIDDLVIYVDVSPIDGELLEVARAGSCLVRNDGYPLYGTMLFDSADVDAADISSTILHEMGHVLGIGSSWTNFNLVNYTGDDCPETPLYSGENARQVWQDLGGTGDVPVEQDGGAGTRCGHWDEGTFDTELMTGFGEGDSSEELSLLTIASLQDLNYDVDASQADDYSLPECAPECEAGIPASEAADRDAGLETQAAAAPMYEVLLRPVATVDADGTVQMLGN